MILRVTPVRVTLTKDFWITVEAAADTKLEGRYRSEGETTTCFHSSAINHMKPYTPDINVSQNASYFKYFMSNTQFRIAPDIQTTPTTDVYTLRCTFGILSELLNYNIATNTTSTFTDSFTTFTPELYTHVSYPNYGFKSTLILGSSAVEYITYTPGLYSTSNYTINSNINRYDLNTSSKRELQITNLYSNALTNVGTVTTNNLVSTTATINNITNYVKQRDMNAATMYNGSTNFATMHIACSMKGISPADVDDHYLINAGKLTIYNNNDYGGTSQSNENDSYYPVMWTPSTQNTTVSIKVYYRINTGESWSEIVYANISS